MRPSNNKLFLIIAGDFLHSFGFVFYARRKQDRAGKAMDIKASARLDSGLRVTWYAIVFSNTPSVRINRYSGSF